jgi:hypothetical protein
MHAALSDRGANLAGLGISQCAPLGGRGKKLMRALSFAGTSDFINVAQQIAAIRSVSMWFNPVSIVGNRRFFQWGTNGFSAYLLTGSYVLHALYAGLDYNTGYSVTPNRWSHLLMIVDGVKMYSFINGILVHSIPVTVQDTPQTFLIGTTIGSQRWNGLLDTVRVFNRSLPRYEIAEHYRGIFSNNDGLVGRWDLDEADGLIAYDKSGYGNHGTLVGNPQRVQVFKPDRLPI